MKSRATCILTCAALLGSVLATQVQQYPSRPLRAIVPSAPGGTTSDVIARLLPAKLGESLVQYAGVK